MNWLEDAIEFDLHLGSDHGKVKDVTNDVFGEITKRLRIRKKARTKETLKLTLLNLWVGLQQGVPVYYSRTANDYSRSSRYGLLHVKYNRLIPIIDTLESMGLVAQKIGWYDRQKGIARQTRMYPTKSLIDLFTDLQAGEKAIMHRVPPRETIQLKDSSKKLLDYKETDSTIGMRRSLFEYNEFIKKQDITLDVTGDCLVDRRFLKELYQNLLKGVVGIDRINIVYRNLANLISSDTLDPYNITLLSYSNLLSTTLPYIILDPMYDSHTSLYDTLILYLCTMTHKVREMKNRRDVKMFLEETRPLAEFGIERLTCHINYEVLHRVFNNGSFDLGGRFFGAYHIGLGKDFRRQMKVNGEPTVELDYSALHIRMLYHMEGIDYREDPYSVLCEKDQDRKMYKLLQLIAINAANEKQALAATRDVFRKNGITHNLTNASIEKLLDRYKQAHRPIQKYLNTGIGLTLQNLDGMITEKVIRSLMENGIPCLPVHDSYIVPERYKQELTRSMIESYERLMGFCPVVS